MSKKFIAVFLYSGEQDNEKIEKDVKKICIDNKFAHNLLKQHKIKTVPLFVCIHNDKRLFFYENDFDKFFELYKSVKNGKLF